VSAISGEEDLRDLELDNKLELANHLKSSWKEYGAEAGYKKLERQLLNVQLDDLQKRARRGEYVSSADFAWIYTRLRDPANTLQWLNRAFDEHASILLELRDPDFDFVRDTPQFQTLVRRVGMPSLGGSTH
jgi:hypothetical protein